MQIAVLTPFEGGGMLQYASQLSNSLTKHVDVKQVVRKGADTTLFDDRIEIQEVPFPNSIANFPAETFALLRSNINHTLGSADLIHLTGRHPHALFLHLAAIRTPFVYTLHDISAHSGEFSLVGELTDRLLIREADRVFVHGKYNREKFYDKYNNKQQCMSIMHGDYSFFREYCGDEVSYDRPELLFFGRIRQYKGIDTLIEAENRISKELDNYQITIAGKGLINDMTAERIANADNIVFLNEYISNEQVCELFARCRAVVLPYTDASQTGVVPIAYSFKKPVIASDVGGLSEVVTHGRTGFKVDPENPDELAYYSSRVLKKLSLAKELGEQADTFRREYMDWDRIAERTVSAYNEILKIH